jgi:hypothetical protein
MRRPEIEAAPRGLLPVPLEVLDDLMGEFGQSFAGCVLLEGRDLVDPQLLHQLLSVALNEDVRVVAAAGVGDG